MEAQVDYFLLKSVGILLRQCSGDLVQEQLGERGTPQALMRAHSLVTIVDEGDADVHDCTKETAHCRRILSAPWPGRRLAAGIGPWGGYHDAAGRGVAWSLLQQGRPQNRQF